MKNFSRAKVLIISGLMGASLQCAANVSASEICSAVDATGHEVYMFSNMKIVYEKSGRVSMTGSTIKPMEGKVGSNPNKVRIKGGGNVGYLIKEGKQLFFQLTHPGRGPKFRMFCRGGQ